jgi:predicted phosphodiesterase
VGGHQIVRILVVSDLHGDLTAAQRACRAAKPDLILSCGDGLSTDMDLSFFTDKLLLKVCLGYSEAILRFGDGDSGPAL